MKQRGATAEAMWRSAADTPLPIVKGCLLLLESCPSCRGLPQITCDRCCTDLFALGIATHRLLRAERT